MRNQQEIKKLVDRILKSAGQFDAQVYYSWGKSLATRFGENAITQNMGGEQEQVRVEIHNGKRKGSMVTNKMDDASLDKMVEIAIEMSKQAPEDSEYIELLGPQEYPEVKQGFFEDVMKLAPGDIAKDLKYVVDRAAGKGYKASGLYEADCSQDVIANTRGLFCYEDRTNVEYSTTIHGPKGSGKYEMCRNSYAEMDAERIAEIAMANAVMAQNPQDIEPDDYTVIFKPLALAQFLMFLVMNMKARDADEGTTYFAGKVGEKLFSDKVNIRLLTDDAQLPSPKFGSDGLPFKPQTWVKNGVLKKLYYDRYWAKVKGVEPDATLYPVFMEGEDKTVDDLVRSCKKGLLVKNLWYIRYVDKRELLLTGMTRDGVFMVEDGSISGPVKNLRWNESPIVFLKNVVGMSRPERVGKYAKIPGVMSKGFTFSSKTESL